MNQNIKVSNHLTLFQKNELIKYGIDVVFLNYNNYLVIPASYQVVSKKSGDNTYTTITNDNIIITINKKETNYHSYCYIFISVNGIETNKYLIND